MADSDFERICAAYWLGQFRRPWQCRSWQKADEAERGNVRRGMAAALKEMYLSGLFTKGVAFASKQREGAGNG